MIHFLVAARKLLPSNVSITIYWLLTTFLIGFAALGLKANSDRTGTIWGVPLVGWDENSDVLQQAFREMLYHVWTFITLPYVCFYGMRPLVRSFRVDFVQFLRYSSSSRIFIESVRILAILAIVLVSLLPFMIGAICGMLHPGQSLNEAIFIVGTCGGTILFIATFIYLFAAIGSPGEIIIALALVTPFFLSGIKAYLEMQQSFRTAWLWLPPGLPYTGLSRPWVTGAYLDNNVLAGIIIAIVIVVFRTLTVLRTRWLLEPS
jgi:hypothetical protein